MKRVYLNTPKQVIKALIDGKEIFLEESGAGKVKLIDGFCVKESPSQFNINYTINLRDKPFVYEQESLKLEVGKFYKTRDGRKAIVLKITEFKDCCVVAIVGTNITYYVSCYGHYSQDCSENDYDLVAPWED